MTRSSVRAKRISCALGAAFLLVMGGGGVPADAASAPALSATELGDLAEFWSHNGVDAATQQELLIGIHAGTLPQSITGAVSPVSTSTDFTAATATTRVVYPDGSVTVSSVQSPDAGRGGGEVSPQDILNCTRRTGTGYQSSANCDIRGSNGFVTLGFVASYTLQQGSYDVITDYNTPLIVACVGGTCSDPGFTQAKTREGATGDAGVTMTSVFSRSDVGSISNVLSLVVGHDRATTVFSPASVGFSRSRP
jgi:hypothetical protein